MRDSKLSAGNTITAGIMLLLVYVTYSRIFRYHKLREIVADVKTAHAGFLLLAVAMVLLYLSCEAFNLKLILKGYGDHISFGTALQTAFVGCFFSGITPSASGGQPVQALWLSRKGVQLGNAASALLLITAGFKSVLLLMASGLLLAHHDIVVEHARAVRYLIALGFFLNLLFITGIMLFLFSRRWIPALMRWVTSLIAKMKLVRDPEAMTGYVENQIAVYGEAAQFLKGNLPLLGVVFLVTAAERCAMFMVPYLVYRSFGLSAVSPVDVIALQTLSAVATDMLPLPGAVGISETVFLRMYNDIFTQGTVAAGVLLSRGVSFYLFMVVSGIVVLTGHVRAGVREQKKQIVPEGVE